MPTVHGVAVLCFALALTGGVEPPRVAVLPLEPVRVPADVLFQLQAELEAAVDGRADAELVAPKETLAHLAAVRALGLSCARERAECQREIAGLAGAPLVVRGEVRAATNAADPMEVTLQLWLTEPRQGRDGSERGHILAALPADDGARTAVLDDALARLFDPAGHGATVSVATDVDSARFSLDGIPWGEASAVELRGLAAGEHELVVEKEGHERFASRLHVGEGDRAALLAALPPAPPELPVEPVPIPAATRINLGYVPHTAVALGAVMTLAGLGLGLYDLYRWVVFHVGSDGLVVARADYATGDIDVMDEGVQADLGELRGEAYPLGIELFDNGVLPGLAAGGLTLAGLFVVGVGITLWPSEEE